MDSNIKTVNFIIYKGLRYTLPPIDTHETFKTIVISNMESTVDSLTVVKPQITTIKVTTETLKKLQLYIMCTLSERVYKSIALGIGCSHLPPFA